MKDTIYRQDAIEAMREAICPWVSQDRAFAHAFAQATMDKIPSAEPERKKGKWIRITQGATPEIYICPFCHRIVETYGVEELLSICYPYCHCGADMRGEFDE